MTVDIAAITYDVELITKEGQRYLLNPALLSLQWEEQIGELAQRATITAANMALGNTWLMALAQINCGIVIYAKWGGAKTLLFDGTIWEWQYVSGTQKELTITAYDYLIRLQQSKDFKYYAAGMTTQAIIGDICKDWGIPLAYQWGQSLTHEKKIFSAEKLSDIIISLLEEVQQKTGEKYVAYYRDKQLQIAGYGANTPVYRFDGQTAVSTSNKLTINNLVTQVKIIGKEDAEGKAPVDDTLRGDTRYGVLQEIIRRDDNKTLAAARAEARTILKKQGQPEEMIQLSGPDLPFTRKGEKVEVSAGNLIGFFFIEGVTHDATTRQMTLTLSRTAKE